LGREKIPKIVSRNKDDFFTNEVSKNITRAFREKKSVHLSRERERCFFWRASKECEAER